MFNSLSPTRATTTRLCLTFSQPSRRCFGTRHGICSKSLSDIGALVYLPEYWHLFAGIHHAEWGYSIIQATDANMEMFFINPHKSQSYARSLISQHIRLIVLFCSPKYSATLTRFVGALLDDSDRSWFPPLSLLPWGFSVSQWAPLSLKPLRMIFSKHYYGVKHQELRLMLVTTLVVGLIEQAKSSN